MGRGWDGGRGGEAARGRLAEAALPNAAVFVAAGLLRSLENGLRNRESEEDVERLPLGERSAGRCVGVRGWRHELEALASDGRLSEFERGRRTHDA